LFLRLASRGPIEGIRFRSVARRLSAFLRLASRGPIEGFYIAGSSAQKF